MSAIFRYSASLNLSLDIRMQDVIAPSIFCHGCGYFVVAVGLSPSSDIFLFLF